MDQCLADELREKLDKTWFAMTSLVKQNLYDNITVGTVRAWFEGNDSIRTLKKNIQRNTQDRWPFLEAQIRQHMSAFEQQTQRVLARSMHVNSPELDSHAIAEGISQSISIIISMLGTAFVAMICGGAGTAFIASGPVGWVMGAVVGAFAFFVGKTTMEDAISPLIVTIKIPALLKAPAKGKVVAELKLHESRFEQETYTRMRDHFQPPAAGP
jgi:hypothetical protein